MATPKTTKTTTKTTTKKTTTKKEEPKAVVEEVQEEVKEEVKAKPKKEETIPDNIPDILKKAIEAKKKRDQLKKLYLPYDTPYLSAPNKLLNVAGIIPKGTVCYVEQEIDNGEQGKFWQVAMNKFINKNWEVEVL